MSRLPTVAVSDEFFDLIRDFAASKRISTGNAVRRLLEASPELIKFADERNVKIDAGIREWGGKRTQADIADKSDS